MKRNTRTQWLLGLAAGAVVLMIAAGCQSEKPEVVVEHGEDFPAADAPRPVNDFIEVQAAIAARADATLRAYHFDGPDLNSLGEERIDLFLKSGETTSPLVVYLDLSANDPFSAQRRSSALAYFKDHGLTDEQVQFKSGPNPDLNSMVAPILASQTGAAAAPSSNGATPPPQAATSSTPSLAH